MVIIEENASHGQSQRIHVIGRSSVQFSVLETRFFLSNQGKTTSSNCEAYIISDFVQMSGVATTERYV